eukprot:2255911-Rhodomonas_salina.2
MHLPPHPLPPPPPGSIPVSHTHGATRALTLGCVGSRAAGSARTAQGGASGERGGWGAVGWAGVGPQGAAGSVSPRCFQACAPT